jgi:acetyltransferase-like isoleucine patch superfamily enzyme
MTTFSYLFRVIRKIIRTANKLWLNYIAYIKLWGNGVKFNSSLVCNGIPVVDVHKTAICKIGDNCRINSNIKFNPIGRYSPTFIIVRENAKLIIGNNTGISSSALICQHEIRIGDNVKLGGNVVIYDTDFHSVNFAERTHVESDRGGTIARPVVIEDNVFVGAHSTILKGVTIGKAAVIGACSVVTKDIPANEIWAGNPARFIKVT